MCIQLYADRGLFILSTERSETSRFTEVKRWGPAGVISLSRRLNPLENFKKTKNQIDCVYHFAAKLHCFSRLVELFLGLKVLLCIKTNEPQWDLEFLKLYSLGNHTLWLQKVKIVDFDAFCVLRGIKFRSRFPLASVVSRICWCRTSGSTV